MICTQKRLRICTALLIANLAFIWGNSLLPGEISGAISDWVKNLLALLFPGDGPIASGGGLIRKIAHFTEFAALGALLGWLFAMLQKKKYWPLLCGITAACVDETIQRFVPDRGPSLKDVGIDACGVLTGMILLYLGHTYLKKKFETQPMEDK